MGSNKTGAENFIERLWAFLTIENLLDEKEMDIEAKEAANSQLGNDTDDILDDIVKQREEKALKLALRYNFVTKLTSLIVVKPNYNDTMDGISNGTIATPARIHSLGDRINSHPHYSFGHRSFSMNARMGSSAPHSRMPMSRSGPPLLMSPPVWRSANVVPRRGHGTANKSARRKLSKNYMSSSNNLNMLMATSIPKRLPDMSMMPYDMSDVYSDQHSSLPVPSPIVPTTTQPKPCQIEMFSRTYLRGDSLILSDATNSTISDLSTYSFDDKLSSFVIQGPCCWQIFESTMFTGASKRFDEGEYKSSTTLGADLAKEASSIKIVAC